MIAWETHAARPQPMLDTDPYDRWVTPKGEIKAEFHRLADNQYIVRFPDEADFRIDLEREVVEGWPAPGTTTDHFASLFHHGITPLIGNHTGGLFLHGSAVAIDGRAFAFLGLSRGGKTTLAGALAKVGHPFLTEDVIELVRDGDGYLLLPKRSALRLFADSAAYLLERDLGADAADEKQSLPGGDLLPFCDYPCRLAGIFLLGQDHAAPLTIAQHPDHAALPQLLPHSFVLDVEDKSRLRAHFGRIAQLSETVACYALDYPRDYARLPAVVDAVVKHGQKDKS